MPLSKVQIPRDTGYTDDSSDWQSCSSSTSNQVNANGAGKNVSFVPGAAAAPKFRKDCCGGANPKGPLQASPAELALTRKDALSIPSTIKTLSATAPPRPTRGHVTPGVNGLSSATFNSSPDHVCVGQARPSIYLLPPPSLTPSPHHYLHHTSSVDDDIMNPTQSPNVSDLLVSLSSTEDATRKMAAFKLQSLINYPAFADLFVAQGGLLRLRELLLVASGNTLAYGLASFARLLEVDQGWDGVNEKLVKRV